MIKSHSLLIAILTALGGLSIDCYKPLRAALTILDCNGRIPRKTACLIKPVTFKTDIYRIDICKENPFPDYRSSPNYSGSGCMALFRSKGRLYRFDIRKGPKYKIPQRGRENIKTETYNYLAIIFKNGFTSSGEYTTGDKTYMTAGVDKKTNKKILKINGGNPEEFTTKLSNWRGESNKDNEYCDNNGGTFSRCEIKYNGYELTAVGLGNDLIEDHGSKLKYVFYMNKLLSPINLNEDLDSVFYLKANNRLEVYGKGNEIQSITIAPFIFDLNYN